MSPTNGVPTSLPSPASPSNSTRDKRPRLQLEPRRAACLCGGTSPQEVGWSKGLPQKIDIVCVRLVFGQIQGRLVLSYNRPPAVEIMETMEDGSAPGPKQAWSGGAPNQAHTAQ